MQIYGFWDTPFFQFLAKIPQAVKSVTHSDLFKKTFPIIVEQAAKRFGVPENIVNTVASMID